MAARKRRRIESVVLAGSCGHWPKRSVSKLQQSSRTSVKLFSTRQEPFAMLWFNGVKSSKLREETDVMYPGCHTGSCSCLPRAVLPAGHNHEPVCWHRGRLVAIPRLLANFVFLLRSQVPPQPDFEQADAQPPAAAAAPAFRLRSTGCLFTWNGLSLNPMIFQEFVAWIHTLEFIYRFSATVERPAGKFWKHLQAFGSIRFGSSADP